jgi:hypothetical protein
MVPSRCLGLVCSSQDEPSMSSASDHGAKVSTCSGFCLPCFTFPILCSNLEWEGSQDIYTLLPTAESCPRHTRPLLSGVPSPCPIEAIVTVPPA